MSTEKEIKLVQFPIITHKLEEAGKAVSKRIEDLEIGKQIATLETVKSLKDLRIELNKEFADFETQRKFIKEGVNNPYNEFESVYKTEISERYKNAIDLLKDKIAFVEDKVKSDKKEVIESYFKELCVAEKIDFLIFEKLEIEINLSTTEKKYKEQVNQYILKVVDDLSLIKSTDYEAEILVEYKISLNVSSAITCVKNRKEKEKEEQERIKAEQKINRINALQQLGLVYVEITNAYEFNTDIYLTISDIHFLLKDDFNIKYQEIKAKINDLKQKELQSKTIEIEIEVVNPEVVVYSEKKVENITPISAPILQTKKEIEDLKTASFEVTATMTQLRALGVYMKENNIIYKNI